MKKRLDARDAEPSSTPQMARESAARTEVASSRGRPRPQRDASAWTGTPATPAVAPSW